MNHILRWFGYMIVPRPPSAKMLREQANVGEVHHPAGKGLTVAWMHRVAKMMGDDNA